MKKYFEKMKWTFDQLNTNVHDWDVGEFGKVKWPREESLQVCQLCGYHPLYHRYYLFNSTRLITIQVGSECVRNWVEYKYEVDFDKFYNDLMRKSFKPWVSNFFSEYRDRKYLTGYTKWDKRFSKKVYDIVNDIEDVDISVIKRAFKKAQKLSYKLPPQLFGYGVFDIEKTESRGLDDLL